MPELSPTLHMFCGKIASGKSTLARTLAQEDATVLISEDEWLAALYPNEIKTVSDYVRYSERLKPIIGRHVVTLLRTNVSVALDFPANTVQSRAWMKRIINEAGAAHRLHVFDTPDEVCLARLRSRNEGGSHPFEATEQQYQAISAHFEQPSKDEGFMIERYRHAP